MRIRVEFLPIWSNVRRLRAGITELLGDCDAEVVHRLAVATSELCENIVKYGEPENEGDKSLVEITKTANDVTIITQNRTRDRRNLQNVLGAIEALKECGDAEVLYLNRMKQMLETGEAETDERSSKLGLVRVAAEAGFELSSEYENDMLTVTARQRV